MNRRALLKAFVLGLAFTVTGNAALWANDATLPVNSFAGIIRDKSVAKLVKPISAGGIGGTYALSIIGDAKAFDTLIDATGLKKSPFDVDWEKQAVVVVVLKEHTYWLDYKQWTAKDGVGELVFHWDGIEPDYGDRFPALMYRFDKKGLTKVVVKCETTNKVLGEIPCP
jgi:hypothetical protein